MKIKHLLSASALSLAICGCNMPTPIDQITPVHTSSAFFEAMEPERLIVELDDLRRRESQLIKAQEKRINSSSLQAFLFGYGQGDGIEASELAAVRGNINAVLKAMALQGMEVPQVVEPEPEPEPEQNRKVYFGRKR